MQQVSSPHYLKNGIIDLLVTNGLDDPCFTQMLDYTIKLFETNGLGSDYYGYHNIEHELEVTYVSLISSQWNSLSGFLTKDDMKYLYVAALFHDFDPEKIVDKPHEDAVIRFLRNDKQLLLVLNEARIDIEIIEALILRTTFPWSGKLKETAEKQIEECFKKSIITKNNPEKQKHLREVGHFLSVIDRVSGYVLGDFSRAMELAKKNAHALAWHPEVIVRRSVPYFEDLLNNESEMCERVLRSLPKYMRKIFMDNVLSFIKLREKEIQIKMSYIYDNLRLFPVIEPNYRRNDQNLIKSLFEIFKELPTPLQFKRETFAESIQDSDTILNTLRLGNEQGPIIGFAKGGPLENYTLRNEIKDENYGKNNTVFLEPLAIRQGYWGLRGGREIRLLFTMQGQAKRFKYLTSFALRDVIENRIKRNEAVEFVIKLDPTRWDYYRLTL